jgi:hypothetical protein
VDHGAKLKLASDSGHSSADCDFRFGFKTGNARCEYIFSLCPGIAVSCHLRNPLQDRRLFSEEPMRNTFVVPYPDSRGTRSWIANM